VSLVIEAEEEGEAVEKVAGARVWQGQGCGRGKGVAEADGAEAEAKVTS